MKKEWTWVEILLFATVFYIVINITWGCRPEPIKVNPNSLCAALSSLTCEHISVCTHRSIARDDCTGYLISKGLCDVQTSTITEARLACVSVFITYDCDSILQGVLPLSCKPFAERLGL